MLAFTLCRLPYWLYFVIKLVKTIKGGVMWDLNYALTALNILNCALNPFLYAFLNETICAAKKINDLTCKVILYCCCFTNSEFEDFEKNNPFDIKYDQMKGVENHRIVKNTKVKFIDVDCLPKYADGLPPNRDS
ncbi:hypothetical protein NQ314_006203 [Rhamnusium bicolor]|uniref:G-protein coupled receptors family 1 profile domain-containing protein n=1 Tax=Rhamnusium bicolor TaxID=1586634 RepID=A0AAV8Z960_9CUCU|nr:hypothetical protein NQ314_006203 [Rhamnusium bicolor]